MNGKMTAVATGLAVRTRRKESHPLTEASLAKDTQ